MGRFLKPSQVRGIDTEAFMRQQAIATNLHEQSILGYRGLTGKTDINIFCHLEKKNCIKLIDLNDHLIFISFSLSLFHKMNFDGLSLSDDRMQILQRFQPHCQFANFEEVVF